ncbi:MAG: HAMP domain-containing methyl-accepting chemotaxis protein [Sulfuricellaceae bacterium]|nr:HAMP domain-containing methyl-accepting chemotaxis protein [Sulfuricellaceae bacterium]
MLEKLRGRSLVINQAVVLSVLLILGVIGFLGMRDMKISADLMGQGKDVVADILPPPLYLIEAQLVSNDLFYAVTMERQPLIDKLHALKKEYDSRNIFWDASNLDQDLRSSLMGEQRKHADLFWDEALAHFVPAIQANDKEAARTSAQNLRNHYEAHRKGVDTTVILASKYASDKLDFLTLTAQRGYLKLGVAAGLGCALVLLLTVPTINRIYRSLREAEEAATAIAAGNLSHPMPHAGKDEVGKLVGTISIMRDNLRELVAAVHQNVEAVTQAAGELATVSNNSAQVSENQSAAASSMFSAMVQLSESIDQVEAHSHKARDVALISGKQSEEGSRIIHEAADGMRLIAQAVNATADTLRELENFSGQISSVVNLIREIAEQTNLLAFNAAIEAAGAGVHGQRFSVVASEVRKLAESTANSTEEISSMIEKIQRGTQRAVQVMEAGVQQVNEGVEQANRAGESVTSIRTSSAQVTRSVDEIAFALKEQVSSTREISRMVERIAQSAEANSLTGAKTASSADQLEGLARQLKSLAGKFRIT